MPAWLIKLGAALLLLAGAWVHGHHVGAEAVAEAWAASDRQREAEEIAARDQHRQQALAAATDYEASRVRSAAALASARADLRNALQRPICPLGGRVENNDGPTLADLPVPASAVDRLRHAAAGVGPG